MWSAEWLAIVFLMGLMCVIALAIILQKNLYHAIIYLALSSVIAGVLFTLFDAPDLALAEIAVGSALVPFVYVIAITKQRAYLVLDEVMDEHSQQILRTLQHFCREENLKLKLLYKADVKDYELRDVLRKSNVEMIIRKGATGYEMICKSTSALDDRALKYVRGSLGDLPLTHVRIGEDVKED